MTCAALLVASTLWLTPQATDFRPETLGSHDPAVGYSGLRYGMTDSEVKRRYRTTRGAVRPEALRLVTPESSPWIVDALLDGRGGNAKVQAFRLVPKRPTQVQDLVAEVGATLERRYPQTRYTDYSFFVNPEKGLLIHVNGENDNPLVTAVYLGSKAVADVFAKEASAEVTPIQKVPDPGENWNRTLIVGRTDVEVKFDSTNRPGSLSGRFPEDLADDLMYDLRRRNDAWQFVRGESGRVTFKVTSTRFKENGEATFNVSATIEAWTPYGTVNASAYESSTFREDYRNRVSRLCRSAMDELLDDAVGKVRRLGPRPAAAFENDVMTALMNALTQRKSS